MLHVIGYMLHVRMLDFLANKFGFIFIVLIVFFLWLAYLTLLLQSYIRGKKKVLEEVSERGVDSVLQDLALQTKKQELDIKELYRISDELSNASARGLSHTGLVRYNPFANTGGDLSFSIALLNTYKNGLVITGLHTREGTRIFSKPIENGISPYPLSKEEKGAIEKAISS